MSLPSFGCSSSTQRCVVLLALLSLFGCLNQEPPWQPRIHEEGAWLLAVAPLASGVLATGGQPGFAPRQPGSGLLLVVPDDAAQPPLRLKSPQPGMLWWAHTLSAAPGAEVVWLCGEGGSVLRYAAKEGGPPELVAVPAATSATLYGIWAFSDDDVWAVGGDDGSPGVILHGGRNGLLEDRSVPWSGVLYKLYAADREHLFVVGSAGTLLRRVDTRWILDPPPPGLPTTERLLTAYGVSQNEVYAVGGLGAGRLLAWDGARWSLDAAGTGFDALAGLFVTNSEVLITGQRGFIARRTGASEPFAVAAPATTLDLHGALVRGQARYAVGGNLSQYRLASPQGVLLQQGAP